MIKILAKNRLYFQYRTRIYNICIVKAIIQYEFNFHVRHRNSLLIGQPVQYALLTDGPKDLTYNICTTLQGRRHAMSCFEGECAYDDGEDKWSGM